MTRKSEYRKYMTKDGRILLGIMVNKKFPRKISFGGQLYEIPFNYPAAWPDQKVKNWTNRELEALQQPKKPDPEHEQPESD